MAARRGPAAAPGLWDAALPAAAIIAASALLAPRGEHIHSSSADEDKFDTRTTFRVHHPGLLSSTTAGGAAFLVLCRCGHALARTALARYRGRGKDLRRDDSAGAGTGLDEGGAQSVVLGVLQTAALGFSLSCAGPLR